MSAITSSFLDAKCHFVAIDIFSGKKMEDLVPSSHTTMIPFVKKEELQCM